MNSGICTLSAVPLRKEPSECSEMVSQLIFGDCYTVLEQQGNWLKICTSDCQYEGWLGIKYHLALDDNDFATLPQQQWLFVRDFMMIIGEKSSQQLFPIFAGCSFPMPNEQGIFHLGNKIFEIPNWNTDLKNHFNNSLAADDLLKFATIFLRAPYLWGGRTPAGIDCSGFSQLIYKSAGMIIPRDASQQVELGEPIDFASEMQVGDLAFFQNEEGRIIHVGMVCGKNKIIHASGQVRIDTLDEAGIFNVESGQYSHKLRIIKRLLQ